MSALPYRYRIVVRGEVGAGVGAAFAGMTIRSATGRTSIEGEVADQAALQGLIDRIGDFGLEIVSVDQVEREDGAR